MNGLDRARTTGRPPPHHRAVAALREQWLFAALLGLALAADVALSTNPYGQPWGLVPGAAVMVLLALRARWYPLSSGVLAAVVMLASTAVSRLLVWTPVDALVPNVLLSENAAGLLLVLYAFWIAPRSRAIPVTAVLVLACLAAVLLRRGTPHPQIEQAMLGGLLQLVLVVGTGMYLRGRSGPGERGPLQSLLRKHWPVIAALCVLLFTQVVATDPAELLPDGLVLLLSCLVMSGLAVLAPLRPVEAAVLGAITVVLMTALSLVLRVEGQPFVLGAVPPTVLASGMLLTAFVTRHAEPRPAFRAVSALVGAGLVGAYLMPGARSPTAPSDYLGPAFMGGVLLLVSVGTGMYFRARDDERARGVAAAVTNAQQAERMALARELHDVVAHHITGIVVQAQAAQIVARRAEPGPIADSLAGIEAAGSDALASLRRVVGLLRDTDDASPVAPGPEALGTLVARFEDRGPRVRLRLPDDGAAWPPEVTATVYRVVQESLTNITRHASQARSVVVDVGRTPDGLSIEVSDDAPHAAAVRRQGTAAGTSAGAAAGTTAGTDPALDPRGGYGLVGMRERVEALGGTLRAGLRPDGGWTVLATLPLDGEGPR